MSKFSSIQEQLEKASGRKPAPAPEPTTAAPTPTEPPPRKHSSREGKIHIGAYLKAAHKSSMHLVRAQTGEDVQQLLARALNEIYRQHNVPVVDDD